MSNRTDFDKMIEDYNLYFCDMYKTNSYLDENLDISKLSFEDCRRMATIVHLIEVGKSEILRQVITPASIEVWTSIKMKLNACVDGFLKNDLILFNHLCKKSSLTNKRSEEDNRYTLLSYGLSKSTFYVAILRNITTLKYLEMNKNMNKLTNGSYTQRLILTDMLMNETISAIPKIKQSTNEIIEEGVNINSFIDSFFNRPIKNAFEFIRPEVYYYLKNNRLDKNNYSNC